MLKHKEDKKGRSIGYWKIQFCRTNHERGAEPMIEPMNVRCEEKNEGRSAIASAVKMKDVVVMIFHVPWTSKDPIL